MKKLIVLTLLSVSLFSCKKEEIKPAYEIGMEYGGGVIIGVRRFSQSSVDPNNPNGISNVTKKLQLIIGLVDKTEIPIDLTNYGTQAFDASGIHKIALNYCENLNVNGYSDWTIPTEENLQCTIDPNNVYFTNNIGSWNPIGEYLWCSAYWGAEYYSDWPPNCSVTEFYQPIKTPQFNSNNYSVKAFWCSLFDPIPSSSGGVYSCNNTYTPPISLETTKANIIPIRVVDIPADSKININFLD